MLSESRITAQLDSPFFHLALFDSVESTNLIVKQALSEGKTEGFVACALEQKGGYGRQGRIWQSPYGGLYVSVGLTPKRSLEELPTLSLVVCLAVKQALEALGLGPFAIKWPNDLLLSGEKQCGISLENTRFGVCVGIGVNIFSGLCCRSDLSSGHLQTIEAYLVAVLNALEKAYKLWNEQGFQAFHGRYQQALYNKGQYVRLEDIYTHTLLEGCVCGVNEQGKLLLRQKDGSYIAAASGEVHTISASD